MAVRLLKWFFQASRTAACLALYVALSGCAQQKGEPVPVEVGKLDDVGLSTIGKIDLANATEVDLVEKLAAVRADYKRLLKLLEQWYLDKGYYQKSRWAARELNDVLHVKTYPYLTVTDIQRTDLTPAESIPEADALYEKAKRLYEEGQILPFMNDKRKLKESLALFKQLIKTYPTSDKIDDAAFYAGELSKEYFNDNEQAVRYYELAMKWDPKTPHPVRFQCAVIYDFRLHNRAKALEMYRRVLEEEPDIDRTNTEFATTRIGQLLKEEQAQQQPKTSTPPEE